MFLSIPSYYMVPNKKGEWISEDELWFKSKVLDCMIRVPKHSLNNLASIPPVFRTMFPVNGVSRPMAALHDYLYEVNGKGIWVVIEINGKKVQTEMNIPRKQADEVFKEALQATRLSYIKSLPHSIRNALDDQGKLDFFTLPENQNKPLCGSYQTFMMYAAVRLGGWAYWSK